MVSCVCRSLAVAALTGAAWGQTVYTYIGQVSSNSVLIAWGTTQGKSGENTIGRSSKSLGPAAVRIADRTLNTKKNWVEVKGLRPDTAYPYEVSIRGERAGGGTLNA